MNFFSTDINTRLIASRKHFGLSQGKAAEESGFLQKDISRFESGAAKYIPDEYIQYLYKKGINLNWFYTGEGDMISQPQPHPQPQHQPQTKKEHTKHTQVGVGVREPQEVYSLKDRIERPPIQISYPDNESNTRYIPFIDTRAAAGLPAYYESKPFWNDLPTLPVPLNDFRTGTYIAIQVTGDSMQPRLNPGDILYAKYIDNTEDIRENYIHVVVTVEGVVVKRILNRLKDKNGLALKSDNPAYSTYIEKSENILQVWRVEAFTSFNLANPNIDIFKRLNDLEARMARIERGK